MKNQKKAQEPRDHWKTLFNNEYLGAWSLKENEERLVKISGVTQTLVKSQKSPNGEECPIIYFEGHKLPMVLNKINCKRIEKTHGAIYSEWIGKEIALYVEFDVQAFGSKVDALRVREGRKQIDDLRDLYNGLKDLLTPDEISRADRILSNNEKSSFGKLYKFLKSKYDEHNRK